MTIPKQVEIELQNAIKKIGDVLAETNLALSQLDSNGFETVGGTLSFTDPEVQFGVLRWSFVLLSEEAVFKEVRETSVVGIYCPDGNVQFKTLMSMGLKFCPEDVEEWYCCRPDRRCIDVSGPGDPKTLRCKKDSNCDTKGSL